jgi:DNA-directed RNA polymerase specialized sigma24 family protein
VKRTSSDHTSSLARAHGRLDRPAPGPDFTSLIEARDFLDTLLPSLNDEQQRTLRAWSRGTSCREIALAEGLTERAVHYRLSQGLQRLRRIGRAAAAAS